MPTKQVRISDRSYEQLEEMAKREDVPMTALLDEAVCTLKREKYIQRFNDGYASLRRDPQMWATERDERDEWDGVLADGLEDEF